MHDQTIPIGLCQCGCGAHTRIVEKTRSKLGLVKGQPRRFLVGHNRRRTVEDYRVDTETGCWVWLRTLTVKGYGCAWDSESKRLVQAHRLYYERLIGRIPEGLELDHVRALGCRSRACVNPAHLEPVTRGENLRRGSNTKLDADKVRDIRKRVAAGESHRSIAIAFGIAGSTVSSVVTHRNWRDV